jgi:hypothetical protein
MDYWDYIGFEKWNTQKGSIFSISFKINKTLLTLPISSALLHPTSVFERDFEDWMDWQDRLLGLYRI